MFWKKNESKESKEVNKYKRLLIFLCILLGLLFIGISQVLKKVEEKSLEFEGAVYDEESLHEEYNPDSEKDPFKNQLTKSVDISTDISTITFLKPKKINHQMEANTASKIVEANEKSTLFKAFGNQAYIYHQSSGEKYLLGDNIVNTAMCSDNRYLAFISDENQVSKIISYPIDLGRSTEMFSSFPDEKITNVICDDKRIFFTVENKGRIKTTKSVPIHPSVKGLKPSEEEIKIKNSSDIYVKNDNGIYVYMPNSNTLKPISFLQNDAVNIPVIVDNEVEDIHGIDISQNGQLLVLYQDRNFTLNLSVNGKTTTVFSDIFMAKWYDEEHILVLDSDILYLYHINNNDKTVLKSDVSHFIISNGDIYYQDGMGTLFLMKKADE